MDSLDDAYMRAQLDDYNKHIQGRVPGTLVLDNIDCKPAFPKLHSPKLEQVGGDHYKDRPIQPITYILTNKLDFCEGNVVKYVTRWRSKNGVEDLRKARQYLDFLIENDSH